MKKELGVTILNDALCTAALVPYNTATALYHLAAVSPDSRFGGSCIDKLTVFSNAASLLPIQLIATDERKSVRHFAAISSLLEERYYCDPFLWQKEILLLNPDNMHTAATLISNMSVLLESVNKLTGLPTVSLRASRNDLGTLSTTTLTTHLYTDNLPTLPSKLQIKFGLPSFSIHLVDQTNSILYKVWFNKKTSEIQDIWSIAADGARTKVSQHERQSIRKQTFLAIEQALDATISELITFFAFAFQMEQSFIDLSNLDDVMTEDDSHS